MPNSRRMVIGLGTGRCGSRSLAAWLNSQQGAHVSHEMLGPAVPWQDGDSAVWEAIRNFPIGDHLTLTGDVACYYLPYVERILSVHPLARFVCLKRDREETIASFIKKTPRKNHWVNHDGIQWRHSPWDHCFPKYLASSKEDAIGRYWDEYYGRAAELQSRFPSLFRIFPTESLNTEDGQCDVLDFLTVPQAARRFAVGIRLNAAKPRGVRRLIHHLRRLLPGQLTSRPEELIPAKPDGGRRRAAA